MQPWAGLNFYRWRMIDKDATFRYSPVRKIDFSNPGDDITVYPVPVVDGKLFIASSAHVIKAVLFDATGRSMKSFNLKGNINTLDVSGIAKGSYQLKIFTENSTYTQKIIIQ